MSAQPFSLPSVDFPLACVARRRYQFNAPSFADFILARELADKINHSRDLKNHPELTVKAGRLAATGLLDEIFAEIIRLYVEEVQADALAAAPAFLDGNVGELPVAELLAALEKDFTPTTPVPGRPEAVERLLRLYLANNNPAHQLYLELFQDSSLPRPAYREAISTLAAYFATLPPYGPDDQNLFELLLTPSRLFPDSLEDQLKYIARHWEKLIPNLASRLLVHLDLIREEEKPQFFGPGPSLVPDYSSGGAAVGMHEFEAFTADKEWMPHVVLIAKQTYVWLDQLSKKYGHTIHRLDQVPDAELDELSRRGISGLWLIGVWQRSNASKTIKRMTGNPDAISSAYSLHSYDIAWEIGGQEALENLKSRAAARGIRLASDMVPNHMAIDSQWVIEHPDWFISLPYPPFPHADFNTPDLCQDSRAQVFIEAGYYTKTDASVVFKRVDSHSGETRYIYHGNDGTSFPWNDTAQLNYLIPEVREAVMHTILHVARQFPVIRFDAAMTLAKRHYHRLWFPAPGHGGDIPSRAGRGLTPDQFDAAFPHEFWREVVDRLAVEAPDTLLLAEAFWLMEGYFVRTLGMHRVYNSAFMVMLRDEENAKYRLTLRNTLEFDPDILGRFVNFMNNPDEKTAVEQFGKGDKYFGVCTLLATLPGLPMFGHGQIEGYTEKYGMEYPRAYWDEVPDAPFMAYHEKIITPLLRRRDLFSGSQNFTLYDFWSGDGHVNEDVFVYSNRHGNQRALVIYNNRHSTASGWLKTSVGFAQKELDGSKSTVQRNLGEALGLVPGDRQWAIFRDNHSDLEYLRPVQELMESGLYVELKEYGCHVFLDFRQVVDVHGHYAMLAARLGGQGVPNVEIAVKELVLEPLLTPLRQLFQGSLWQDMYQQRNARTKAGKATFAAAWGQWEERAAAFQEQALLFLDQKATPTSETPAGKENSASGSSSNWIGQASLRLKKVLELPRPYTGKTATALKARLEDPATHLPLLWWAALQDLGVLLNHGDVRPLGEKSRAAFDDWLIDHLARPVLLEAGLSLDAANRALAVTRLLLTHTGTAEASAPGAFGLLNALLLDDEAKSFLGVNRFEGTIWFRKEGLEEILEWLSLSSHLSGSHLPLPALRLAAQQSEYKLVRLMEIARAEETSAVPRSPAKTPAA